MSQAPAVCAGCGSAELFQRGDATPGTPLFQPAAMLGGAALSEQYRVVVCRACGRLTWFIHPWDLKRIGPESGWKPLGG